MRALTAEARVSRSTRSASTWPSRDFGIAVRLPVRAASAAAAASNSIGFAAAPPLAAVGPVHLHHLHTGGAELPADPGAVAAGALHPNPGKTCRRCPSSPASCR